jgi:uncharacterized protein YecE (DUF72 family)
VAGVRDVRIGTSGWNYPGGRGAWNGIFYPARRRKGFDELSYYAERFDTVEVNSTFYGQPVARVTAGWVRRTPADFEFSLKLFQKFTHPRMHVRAVTRGLAAPPGPVPEVDDADVSTFRAGLDPIASAGKLGALLAQFPPSFKNTVGTRDYLAGLLTAFREYPVAVELRHRSWSDDLAQTLTLLNEHRAAWVQIDEPKFRFSIRQNYLPNVKGFYYMRLHGRNVEKWWKHERAEDRYDYMYSASELRPFAETAKAARVLVRKLYLYLNNHFAAKSVANAIMIKSAIDEPIAGSYPPELIERYPEIRGSVRTSEAGEGTLLPISSRTRA